MIPPSNPERVSGHTGTKRAPRIIDVASNIASPTERYCTCCERRLNGKVAWLELDQRNNEYHDFGDVPAEKSQGWFVFGIGCAKTLIATEQTRRDAKAGIL